MPQRNRGLACRRSRRSRRRLCYTSEVALTGNSLRRAGVAQLVEQLIRNQQVVGSSPTAGSRKSNKFNDSGWR
jgi:hypothetical protein